MASIERKRVTLHPLKEDGSVDPRTCLYPKTFVDGIVDRNGNEVDIATQEELDLANAKITGVESTISEEVLPTLATKQDELVSGVNIKTINDQPILGGGNIEVATDLSNYVDRTTNQTIGGNKTFEDVTIHNDDTIFNKDIFVNGSLIDRENNTIALKDISLASNLENGDGNGSLIQTNIALSDVEWSSSDESVVTIDEDGNVEAVGIGEAVITAIKAGAEATCDVAVSAPVRHLLRKAPGSDIGLDGYEIITSTSEISSDDLIYMIAVKTDTYKKQFGGIDNGIGTAVDIEADVELSIPLTIEQVDGEDYYTISYAAGTLWCGANKTLRVSDNITENSKWAISFSENNAIITNKTDDTWKIQYNVSSPRFVVYTSNQAPIMLVKKIRVIPVTGIELDQHELELESGATSALTATVFPENATNKTVSWSSSNPDVAEVDEHGIVYAGLLNVTSTAIITATTNGITEEGNHLSDTCTVTVEKQHGPAIKLSSTNLSLKVGDTAKLTAKYVQTNIADGDLAIALGYSNTVSGDGSVAIGNNLSVTRPEQVVIGKYNRNKDDTIFEVGDGSSVRPSNALEVYTDGSVRTYHTPTNAKDVATKEYVDSANPASKHIYLTQYGVHHFINYKNYDKPIIEDEEIIDFTAEPQDLIELICRINLVNFTSKDIGSKIYLFRKKKHNTRFKDTSMGEDVKTKNYNRYYKHPRNWPDITGADNIQGFGYGMLANRKYLDDDNWPDINNFQALIGTNGFIETEWELTAEDINKGYKDINISKMVGNFIVPAAGNGIIPEWITDINIDVDTRLLGGEAFRNIKLCFKIFDASGKQVTFDKNNLSLQLVPSESHKISGTTNQWPLEAYYVLYEDIDDSDSDSEDNIKEVFVPANKGIFTYSIE